ATAVVSSKSAADTYAVACLSVGITGRTRTYHGRSGRIREALPQAGRGRARRRDGRPRLLRLPGRARAPDARRQAEEGQVRLHASVPAQQGRERLRAAGDVATALALLRADCAHRADVAGGRVRRPPLRPAASRADLMA